MPLNASEAIVTRVQPIIIANNREAGAEKGMAEHFIKISSAAETVILITEETSALSNNKNGLSRIMAVFSCCSSSPQENDIAELDAILAKGAGVMNQSRELIQKTHNPQCYSGIGLTRKRAVLLGGLLLGGAAGALGYTLCRARIADSYDVNACLSLNNSCGATSVPEIRLFRDVGDIKTIIQDPYLPRAEFQRMEHAEVQDLSKQSEMCITQDMLTICAEVKQRAIGSGRLFGNHAIYLEDNHCICPTLISTTAATTALPSLNYYHPKDSNRNGFKQIAPVPSVPAPRRTTAAYLYPKNPRHACLTENILNACEGAHQRAKNNGRIYSSLVIDVSGKSCFCPPPRSVATTTAEPVGSFFWGNNAGIAIP